MKEPQTRIKEVKIYEDGEYTYSKYYAQVKVHGIWFYLKYKHFDDISLSCGQSWEYLSEIKLRIDNYLERWRNIQKKKTTKTNYIKYP